MGKIWGKFSYVCSMSTLNVYIKTKHRDRPTKVRFRYRSGVDIDIDYTSEILVNPQFWDSKKQILKRSSKFPSEEILHLNSLISERREMIMDIIISAGISTKINSDFLNKQIQLRLNPPKAESVVNQELGFFELFELFLETHDLSENRRNAYFVVKRALERFEHLKQLKNKNFILNFDNMNIVLLNEIEKYLAIEYSYLNQDKKLIKKFPKYKSNKPRGINTVIGMMKKIRAFNNWACKNSFTPVDAFKRFKINECVYGTPIYLKMDELETLYHYSFSDKPRLEIQRDIFLFQSMTGLRIGDMMNLTALNVIDGSLHYVPQKTKKETGMTVVVPLNKIAISILEKYKNYTGSSLLPFISTQKYNDTLKEILSIAGIDRRVTVLNSITRDYEIKPICEIASSHLARRNFIANIYNCVQDQALISLLTGHVIGSRSFERYRTIDEDLKKSVVSHLEFK